MHGEARQSAPLALKESTVPRQGVPTAPPAVVSGYTLAILAGDVAICTPPLRSHDPGESRIRAGLAYMCQVILSHCTSGTQTWFLRIDLAFPSTLATPPQTEDGASRFGRPAHAGKDRPTLRLWCRRARGPSTDRSRGRPIFGQEQRPGRPCRDGVPPRQRLVYSFRDSNRI